MNRRWVGQIYIDPNTTVSWQTVGSKKNVDKIIKTQLEPQGIPYTIEGKKANTPKRKNAMATKKISSLRGDERRVAKGMMTKGYRYYLKVPGVPAAMYAKTIKMATELVKDYDRGYGSTFGTKGAKVYKLVK